MSKLLFVVLLLSVGYLYAKPINSTECEACKFIVQSVEDWIASNETLSTIETKLNWLCNLLPRYNDTCMYVVETGLPIIIKYLEAFENPQMVCFQIGLCLENNMRRNICY